MVAMEPKFIKVYYDLSLKKHNYFFNVKSNIKTKKLFRFNKNFSKTDDWNIFGV